MGAFNLSYASLTSREARHALNELSLVDPKLYMQITSSESDDGPSEDATFSEDLESAIDAFDDDSALHLSDIVAASNAPNEPLADSGPESSHKNDSDSDIDGFLEYSPIKDSALLEPSSSSTPALSGFGLFEGSGLGRRKRMANIQYTDAEWTRYDD